MLIVFTVVVGCQATKTYSPVVQEKELVGEKAKDPISTPRIEKETITLTAVGDILMHNTLIWLGGQPNGSYQFNFFSEVKKYIEQGDYATTNLETAIAGPTTGYTGYPLFNSPDSIATHLKDSGIDGVVTANNHLLDRGYPGALRTLEVLNGAGLDTMGTKKSSEDTGFVIKELNGIKVGYLAYTYGTNGITVPKEHSYFINLLEKERVLQDISTIRPQVDVLVLILHWGVEYNTKPTEEQKVLARQFLEAGVDAIIGSHPHVVQPAEVLNIGGKDKFIAYSLGNFIGDQRGDERNSGVMVQLKFAMEKQALPNSETISASPEKRIYLEEVVLIPTYSHSYREKGKQQFRVVPVEETIRKIRANEEPILSAKDITVLENVLRTTQERLGFLKFNGKGA